MLLLIASSLVAAAGGLHAGIPVGFDQAQRLPHLGQPEFEGPQQGWAAPLVGADGQPDGHVRVYVGPTVAAAGAWLDDAQLSVQAPLAALPGLGDRAAGNPDSIVVAQDGNVAVLVRVTDPSTGDARDHAQHLLDAIVDQPGTWPAAPAMRQQDGLWFFDLGPNAVHMTVIGGRRPLGEAHGYVELPEQVVAWDAWGRPAVLLPGG